ncbi:MAG: phosphoribosylformylglycinamidine cyclo-ligase [Bacteroidota bacterium]|nr:phosphoribosylformylglycinamidine cyclo-ligase [Candidatus Kapabacteria bacterium]MDW8271608.1 phosphoribosylformylglycinamidine cyclo-ligase [Bacteroidota bacterium]
MDYTSAGVNIEAGDELVRRIKPLVRSTFTKDVLADIGHFGGFFDARFETMRHPVLVSSTDGVGTKLKIAFAMNIHSTIGRDLVNHCVNDILACGAKPLFFLDYFATGKLNIAVAEQVISGLVAACRENGCALIGGETAEMPSLYAEGEYDLAGTIVGVVEKDAIIDGRAIANGDVVIGLRSSGLHTNGYSLARAVLLERYRLDEYIPALGAPLGSALLEIHRSYLSAITPLLERKLVTGLAHITGGGIEGNTRRILPKGLRLVIDWSAWEVPPLFRLIQQIGNVSDDEMRRVFNLGIGMVVICRPEHATSVLALTADEQSSIIGRIEAA